MMRVALALSLAVAGAQAEPLPELETKKKAEIGDDVPGGGPRSAA